MERNHFSINKTAERLKVTRHSLRYRMQRLNMVESQVRPSDVTDRRVLRAMQEVPRELFVPEWARAAAYADVEVPGGRAGASLSYNPAASKALLFGGSAVLEDYESEGLSADSLETSMRGTQ